MHDLVDVIIESRKRASPNGNVVAPCKEEIGAENCAFYAQFNFTSLKIKEEKLKRELEHKDRPFQMACQS